MRLLFMLAVLLLNDSAYAQQVIKQYFDGADTNANNSLIVQLDTAAGNIWQVGRPQKIIFDSAFTLPNVLVTDTVQYYPANNTSRWGFSLRKGFVPWTGLISLRWVQKLDMVKKHAGGIIEFSFNGGQSWQNAFNNSGVYNFYGFSPLSKDTLNTGSYAFSGTDTGWRDIWLCFVLQAADSVRFRFTFQSDSLSGSHEGWMIDNFRVQITLAHTAGKGPDPNQAIKIYPTETNGVVVIEATGKLQASGISALALLDASGRMVDRWGPQPGKTAIDISRHPAGNYLLRVQTAARNETFKIILSH